MIPRNLDEAVQALIDINLKPSHPSGFGMRNSWGLWSGSTLAQWFYTKQIYHADDMSAIIFESYKRHIDGDDRDLDIQIKKYHNHWKESLGKDHLLKMRKDVVKYITLMRRDKIKRILDL
jgi:hypothetical protein